MLHDIECAVANFFLGHKHGVVVVVRRKMHQVLIRSLVLVEDNGDAARFQAVEDALPGGAVAGRLQAEDGFQTHFENDLGPLHAPFYVAENGAAADGVGALIKNFITDDAGQFLGAGGAC